MPIYDFGDATLLLDEGTVIAQTAQVHGIATARLERALDALRRVTPTPTPRTHKARLTRAPAPPLRRGIHPAAAKALKRMAERRKAGRWDGVVR